MGSTRVRIDRAIRVRFRFHSLYVIPDAIFARRTPNGSLCHLHGFYGFRNDAPRNVGGAVTGIAGLSAFLCLDHGLFGCAAYSGGFNKNRRLKSSTPIKTLGKPFNKRSF